MYITFFTEIYTISRCVVKTMYLEKPKYLIIWNRGICTGDEDTDVMNQCNVTVARKFSSLKR